MPIDYNGWKRIPQRATTTCAGDGSVGVHDDYGKEILRRATNGAVELGGPSIEIDYGTKSPARIDGAFKERVAIELETRTGNRYAARYSTLSAILIPRSYWCACRYT